MRATVISGASCWCV